VTTSNSRNPLGRQLASVDAIGDADAVVDVAGQDEIWQRRHATLDPRHQILVPDVVLQHRTGPAGDVAATSLAANL
jgi:hypothetical protein